MELKKLKTKTSLELSENSDIYIASKLKDSLLEALEIGLPFTINGSKVERIDTISCQLLVSAKKAFIAKEIKFSLDSSEQMATCLEKIGLATFFEETAS